MIETLAYVALITSAVAVVATGVNTALLYRKKRRGELRRPQPTGSARS